MIESGEEHEDHSDDSPPARRRTLLERFSSIGVRFGSTGLKAGRTAKNSEKPNWDSRIRSRKNLDEGGIDPSGRLDDSDV